MSEQIIEQLLAPYEYFTDVESSGLGDNSYPIEVGVAYEGGQYEALIQPIEGRWTYWNSQSQKLHGISRNKLKKEGKPAVDVANELNEIFAGKILWCDTPFDVWWFDRLFGDTGVEPKFKVKIISKSLPTELWERLLVKMPTGEHAKHRALEDALDLKECWWKVKREVMRDTQIIERVTKSLQPA